MFCGPLCFESERAWPGHWAGAGDGPVALAEGWGIKTLAGVRVRARSEKARKAPCVIRNCFHQPELHLKELWAHRAGKNPRGEAGIRPGRKQVHTLSPGLVPRLGLVSYGLSLCGSKDVAGDERPASSLRSAESCWIK